VCIVCERPYLNDVIVSIFFLLLESCAVGFSTDCCYCYRVHARLQSWHSAGCARISTAVHQSSSLRCKVGITLKFFAMECAKRIVLQPCFNAYCCTDIDVCETLLKSFCCSFECSYSCVWYCCYSTHHDFSGHGNALRDNMSMFDFSLFAYLLACVYLCAHFSNCNLCMVSECRCWNTASCQLSIILSFRCSFLLLSNNLLTTTFNLHLNTDLACV